MIRAFIQRLRGDLRGVTIVEFALIAPMMIMVMLVVTDFGYRMYVGALVEGTVHRAARRATIGTQTEAQIDDYIRAQLRPIGWRSTIDIEKMNYYEYSGVQKPEKITQDTAPFGSYNVGDCYEDMNGNNVYDTVSGRTGLGGSDDIVYYKVTATFPRVVPLLAILGWSNTEKVTANSVVRNQPFAAQIVPRIKCD